MSVWTKIATWLRALLGLEKDIERIMKPFVKVATELAIFADKQAATAKAEQEQAEKLQAAAAARTSEVERAQKLAGNVGGLL